MNEGGWERRMRSHVQHPPSSRGQRAPVVCRAQGTSDLFCSALVGLSALRRNPCAEGTGTELPLQAFVPLPR